ncbi:hypothetical protein K491DRAFT_741848 [Lophiostoma macrostomum CBS 122681]|uniref:Uncharacterized protein n=1 Tax=Lophiostoma macrostomum CBS 122681 TaxID=1314788 RepID=A0A6A6SHG8_9PLEO|nr:hypothetical protein K491DRAFT_741848 [Lophiostoma macrostomum CBS 122681]
MALGAMSQICRKAITSGASPGLAAIQQERRSSTSSHKTRLGKALQPVLQRFTNGFARFSRPASVWSTLASLNKDTKDQNWNYSIPIDPEVHLSVDIVVQVITDDSNTEDTILRAPNPLILSIVDVIDRAVRYLTPFDALAHGYQASDILWADCSSGVLLWEVWIACRNGHSSGDQLHDCVPSYNPLHNLPQRSAALYILVRIDDLRKQPRSCYCIHTPNAFILAVHGAFENHSSWLKSRILGFAPVKVVVVLLYAIYSYGRIKDLKTIVSKAGAREKMEALECSVATALSITALREIMGNGCCYIDNPKRFRETYTLAVTLSLCRRTSL